MKSPTAGLRFHDLRHQAITEHAESQAIDQTIMAIAGHVSPRMLAHYSHVRLDEKRKAQDALSTTCANLARSEQESGAEPGSYDTKNDTSRQLQATTPVELVENNW